MYVGDERGGIANGTGVVAATTITTHERGPVAAVGALSAVAVAAVTMESSCEWGGDNDERMIVRERDGGEDLPWSSPCEQGSQWRL